MRTRLQLHLGVKTDPIEYRYSYEWLFRLLAEEGVSRVQLGSFFELYHLPQAYFVSVRRQAEAFGLRVESVFTAHRELGGFFRNEPGWADAARRNYARLIDVGALLGAASAGSSAGAVLRDRMGEKAAGMDCYLRHMRDLMGYAKMRGLRCLTIEPMSCLAEPPTTPDELVSMAESLLAHHRAHPDETVPVGYCFDVSHGYADEQGVVRYTPMQLLEAAMPYVMELHLKNTDGMFHSTFGFTEEDRKNGIVDVAAVVDALVSRADRLPVSELAGYLELPGPKWGRDYSDIELEGQLRESLRYLREVFR